MGNIDIELIEALAKRSPKIPRKYTQVAKKKTF